MTFTYLKNIHSYHLVDPNPWPIVSAFGAFMLTLGGVLYTHKFNGVWRLFITGFLLILYMMYTWWRDIIRKAPFEDTLSYVSVSSLFTGLLIGLSFLTPCCIQYLFFLIKNA
jgi:cytochrome c oxidase subunit III